MFGFPSFDPAVHESRCKAVERANGLLDRGQDVFIMERFDDKHCYVVHRHEAARVCADHGDSIIEFVSARLLALGNAAYLHGDACGTA